MDMLADLANGILAWGVFSVVPNIAASIVLGWRYGFTLKTQSIGMPFLIYIGTYFATALLLMVLVSPFLFIIYVFAGLILCGVGFLLHMLVVYFWGKN